MRSSVKLLITFLFIICTLSFSFAGKPTSPGKGGGGGGDDGGGDAAPVALLYTTDDAVVTVATADGQVLGKLTGGSKGWTIKRKATWSPDGMSIAYLEEIKEKNQPRTYDLYTMNADGSAKTFIHRFENGVERYTELAWLPGGYISYQDFVGPMILDMVHGTNQRIDLQLFHDGIGESTLGPGIEPMLAGSEGLIVYRAWDFGVTDESDVHLAIVTVDVNGALVLDPTSIKCLALAGQQGFPVVSPDGLQVAFYDKASGDGGDIIAVVDLDYTNGVDFGQVRILANGGLGEFRLLPTWSPDSQWIAFSWFHDGQAAEIARIRSDGSEFVNVTKSGTHETYPDWIPVSP